MISAGTQCKSSGGTELSVNSQKKESELPYHHEVVRWTFLGLMLEDI